MRFINCIIYMAALGAVFFVLGRLMPKRGFNTKRFPWRCHAWEKKLWRALHVRRWQARVPDMSRLFTRLMPAKRLTEENLSDLPLMIGETCTAELTHVVLSVLGLGMLRIWPGAGGIAVTAVYILLGNLPFIIIQRYNRPRLERLLEHRTKLNAGGKTEACRPLS